MAERVLVIEDDESILELLTGALDGAGYEVIGLRYPDLVVDVVRQERPDLILVDIMLPRMSGIEVADRLWLHGYGTTPMIAVSASNVMYDLARQTPFFEAVMRKPFDVDALLDAVDRVVSAFRPPVAAPVAAHSA